VTLTIRLYVEPSLRMSGAVLLLPLCAFVAWTVRTSSQKIEFQRRQPSLDESNETFM